MTSAQVLEKYGPIVMTVGSESEPGTVYEVRHNEQSGSWSCQCMGYRFNRMCKHIVATQVQLGKAVTQTGKKPVAMPKVKKPLQSVQPQMGAASVKNAQVHVEAQALANDFGAHSGWSIAYRKQAQDRIEAAIRKFMAAVTPVADAVQPMLVSEGSIRMIILED